MDYRTLFGLLVIAFVGACGAYIDESDIKGKCSYMLIFTLILINRYPINQIFSSIISEFKIYI